MVTARRMYAVSKSSLSLGQSSKHNIRKIFILVCSVIDCAIDHDKERHGGEGERVCVEAQKPEEPGGGEPLVQDARLLS